MIGQIQEVLSRLAAVFRRRTLDQDFSEEFAAHIDLLTEQNERRGLDRQEARRQAILQMGGSNATHDLHREARGLPWFERLLEWLRVSGHDLAYAIRSWTPGDAENQSVCLSDDFCISCASIVSASVDVLSASRRL